MDSFVSSPESFTDVELIKLLDHRSKKKKNVCPETCLKLVAFWQE